TEPASQWIAGTIACDGRRIGWLTESFVDDGGYCCGLGYSAVAATEGGGRWRWSPNGCFRASRRHR
ncbi:MAG: hypothetical protein AAF805_10815, partial [Planctomycetota bacterium]